MKFDDFLELQKTGTVRRKPRHIEDRLQISCVQWFDAKYPKLKLLLHHSPNGGRRNVIEAAKFKQMGVRAGFPDLILLEANRYYPLMGIELKTTKGRQSDHQKAYQQEFERHGYKYIIVRSLDEFIKEVTSYLEDM